MVPEGPQVTLKDEVLASMLQGQALTRGLQANLSNEFQSIQDRPRAELTLRKRVPKVPALPRHIIIPDCQIRAGAPMVHLEWIGQWICDQYAGDEQTRLICLGDFADMPSLSSWDRGKRVAEGRRIVTDINASNHGFDLLNLPRDLYNRGRRKKWEPPRDLLLGNHEDRITRACNENASLDGFLSLDLLNYAEWGWNVHPFLEVEVYDGVAYSHYFYNPLTSKPYGGQSIDTRLKTIGRSFTMGHQQVAMYGVRTLPTGERQHGLVAGACYIEDENYRGPQSNHEWRGIVVCNQVENGAYDPMFVSLDYLCRLYEGVRLSEWVEKYA